MNTANQPNFQVANVDSSYVINTDFLKPSPIERAMMWFLFLAGIITLLFSISKLYLIIKHRKEVKSKEKNIKLFILGIVSFFIIVFLYAVITMQVR
jgi:hypothetical protein